MSKKWSVLAVALVMAAVTGVAQAQITLPDTGCDVGGHVTAAITGLGAIVLVVLGGYFAFMLVRRGMRWAWSALK